MAIKKNKASVNFTLGVFLVVLTQDSLRVAGIMTFLRYKKRFQSIFPDLTPGMEPLLEKKNQKLYLKTIYNYKGHSQKNQVSRRIDSDFVE